ncbi:IS3 family transposase [Arcanobacterium phocae]|uniref:IS3 family transposase n=1 Tax=Arcanobacterium phocae TaxID=131112 RepID=UPI001C11C5F2|nr:IS3 family transposase [Arcanobacterium phocae]
MLTISALARYHHARLSQLHKHAKLARAIGAVFDNSKACYGHRSIRLALMKDGWRVSKKLVAKIMARDKLVCITRPKRPYNSYRGTSILPLA